VHVGDAREAKKKSPHPYLVPILSPQILLPIPLHFLSLPLRSRQSAASPSQISAVGGGARPSAGKDAAARHPCDLVSRGPPLSSNSFSLSLTRSSLGPWCRGTSRNCTDTRHRRRHGGDMLPLLSPPRPHAMPRASANTGATAGACQAGRHPPSYAIFFPISPPYSSSLACHQDLNVLSFI
jgi:hypothetical protein